MSNSDVGSYMNLFFLCMGHVQAPKMVIKSNRSNSKYQAVFPHQAIYQNDFLEYQSWEDEFDYFDEKFRFRPK